MPWRQARAPAEVAPREQVGMILPERGGGGGGGGGVGGGLGGAAGRGGATGGDGGDTGVAWIGGGGMTGGAAAPERAEGAHRQIRRALRSEAARPGGGAADRRDYPGCSTTTHRDRHGDRGGIVPETFRQAEGGRKDRRHHTPAGACDPRSRGDSPHRPFRRPGPDCDQQAGRTHRPPRRREPFR